MAVPMAVGERVEPGTPQALFTVFGLVGYGAGAIVGYAPSRDGRRFLVNVPASGEGRRGAAPHGGTELDGGTETMSLASRASHGRRSAGRFTATLTADSQRRLG